jgi:succinate dehydrogenase/fumarate reductase flavoprotein subunit
MTTVPFDTLELARKLEAAGFPSKQAQDTAAALASVMAADLATKQDIRELRAELDRLRMELDRLRVELDSKIELVKRDLTIRLGGMIAAAVAIIVALDRLLA